MFPRRRRTGGVFCVRDSGAQVAAGAAGAGRLRPLPELGADLARAGAAARGADWPAAAAAAGGRVRAGRLAVRPPHRAARLARLCAAPHRHLPGQPDRALAAVRTDGLYPPGGLLTCMTARLSPNTSTHYYILSTTV